MQGLSRLLGSGALALAFATPSMAQDFSQDPNFGTVDLNPGFPDDPYTVEVISGGSINAGTISGDCTGYISDAPDVRLNYGSGSGNLPLILGAISGEDTTLVVNAPDGSWYCDDDGGADLNPMLRFNRPAAGQYDIWIGSYASGQNYDAQLVITELESSLGGGGGGAPMQAMSSGGSGGTAPTYGGITLNSGFTPDPHTVRIQAGGAIAASGLGSACTGYVADAADYAVQYTSGSLPLYISADAMADTTLVVRAPNGQVYCDDDSGEGNNPRVLFQTPMSGLYQIWVGTYSSGALQAAELNISELYAE